MDNLGNALERASIGRILSPGFSERTKPQGRKKRSLVLEPVPKGFVGIIRANHSNFCARILGVSWFSKGWWRNWLRIGQFARREPLFGFLEFRGRDDCFVARNENLRNFFPHAVQPQS